MKYLFHSMILGMIALGIANCAGKPTHLELIVNANKDLNPNKNNIPSPLVLMMYELEDDEIFKKLGYWELHDDAKEKLSGKLLSQSKHIITPDENQRYRILFDKNAKFFGLVGGFREIDKGEWRYIKVLKPDAYNRIELNISKNTIREME